MPPLNISILQRQYQIAWALALPSVISSTLLWHCKYAAVQQCSAAIGALLRVAASVRGLLRAPANPLPWELVILKPRVEGGLEHPIWPPRVLHNLGVLPASSLSHQQRQLQIGRRRSMCQESRIDSLALNSNGMLLLQPSLCGSSIGWS